MKRAICPTCGQRTLVEVCRDLSRTVHGQAYTVPQLTFEECTSCGERVYSPEAMRKIEAYSPSFTARRLRKSSVRASS